MLQVWRSVIAALVDIQLVFALIVPALPAVLVPTSGKTKSWMQPNLYLAKQFVDLFW
jgi:hypothetical protein